jgi:LexA DNA binding domain
MTLSDEDIKEFKGMLDDEFGGNHTEDEARETATRLLDLCMLLAMPVSGETRLSHAEQIETLSNKQKDALAFTRRELSHGRQPSVRDVSKAMGLRSSRSGALTVNSLIGKGLLSRKSGKIVLINPE